MQGVVEGRETIERRLVQLIGCPPDDVSRLGGVLLRHRALTAAAGVAAALSGSTAEAAYDNEHAVDGGAAEPVEDVVKGTCQRRNRRARAPRPTGGPAATTWVWLPCLPCCT